MGLFDVTKRTVFDLALTRGMGKAFPVETLERIITQEEEFLKPKTNNYALLSFIPLVIVAYLVLRK